MSAGPMNAERLLAHYEKIADAPDAIARLRRFVLDLAVRGKLVPQDPNDEPASELLKRIAKEKARLVKAGAIRKPKVLPDVEKPPFDLPLNWRWTPIREVASDRGQEIPQSAFTYIDVTAIDKEAGVVADPKVLEASEAPSRARKITRKGDVIYSCVRPYLLNVAVIETDFDPQPIVSTAFAILNGHGLVVPRYIWIALRSPFMVACVEENQRGQAYPAINDADFAVLPFPLPPLAEQHRIVAKVDELMGLCDRLEAARAGREAVRDQLAAASLARLNAPDPETSQDDARFTLDALPDLTTRPDQIKHLRQTILNLAVRGKLVPQDAKDEPATELLKRIAKEKARLVKAGEIKVRSISSRDRQEPIVFEAPIGWALTTLGEVALKITDGAHKTPTYVERGAPFVSVKDFSAGKLDLSNTRFIPEHEHKLLYQRCDPRRGDILLGRIGTLGKAVLIDTDIEFSLFVSVGLIRFDHRFTNPHFFRLLLNSPFVEAEFDRIKIGGGTHTNKLNLGDLYTVALPLPPLAEQHRIVAKVDALMALCDRLEASLTATAATRRRLLDALLAEALAPAEDREMEAAE
jgi:type I restriction enzyme S subunit